MQAKCVRATVDSCPLPISNFLERPTNCTSKTHSRFFCYAIFLPPAVGETMQTSFQNSSSLYGSSCMLPPASPEAIFLQGDRLLVSHPIFPRERTRGPLRFYLHHSRLLGCPSPACLFLGNMACILFELIRTIHTIKVWEESKHSNCQDFV